MGAPQTRRQNAGRGHYYMLDGHKSRGVTTLIGQGLPKPGLIDWAARTAANYAVDRWDELATLPPSKRIAAIQGAHRADRDQAANRGTEVHKLAERLTAGEEIEVPESLAGHVDSYVRFLDEWEPAPVLVERPVFNRRHNYAGTPDLVADMDGRRWLLDIKTNRSGPFGEVALQLAAYRYAEFYLDADGAEQPMPVVDETAVVWVRSDGYDLYRFTAGPDQFRAFLYVAQVAEFRASATDLKGDSLRPTPRRVAA
ncbi:hypothetical protein [Allonocardiopsis opalescens]|uniref:PD-(D/E)XK nuclease superfamily protein n=1 Tax=Allonocardiopsis opalescens TaxID=1144618 RepID=A0A2T0PPG3_9ACTN|nr:hypothetical protein [Allonocardiopsis opalescens]PRX90698.1 hypothetical protein CLV72_11836 [Allonocardiopsis opalescens]